MNRIAKIFLCWILCNYALCRWKQALLASFPRSFSKKMLSYLYVASAFFLKRSQKIRSKLLVCANHGLMVPVVTILFGFIQIVQADNFPRDTPDQLPRVQLSFTESDPFGFVIGTHFTNYLTQNSAFGFELDAGPSEFRLGGTLAYAITSSSRFKLTAEHFAQNLDFDFVTKKDDQNVGQNALGGMYQYLFSDRQYLKNFNFGAYAATAESEELTPIPFTYQNVSYIDNRNFTGANSAGLTSGVTFSPWLYNRFGVNINYDYVKYDKKFGSSENDSGLGGGVTWQQIFSPHWKINAAVDYHSPFQQYSAGIFWLLPTRPGTRFELNLVGSHLAGDIYPNSDNRVILGASLGWGGCREMPKANYMEEDPDNYLAWTSVPAVAMPAVLVKKDEFIKPIMQS